MQVKADLRRNKPTRGHFDQAKSVEYAIMILHKRPEYHGVEFVSTYYTKENRTKKDLAQVFSRAFKKAHPFWKIRKITVTPAETANRP